MSLFKRVEGVLFVMRTFVAAFFHALVFVLVFEGTLVEMVLFGCRFGYLFLEYFVCVFVGESLVGAVLFVKVTRVLFYYFIVHGALLELLFRKGIFFRQGARLGWFKGVPWLGPVPLLWVVPLLWRVLGGAFPVSRESATLGGTPTLCRGLGRLYSKHFQRVSPVLLCSVFQISLTSSLLLLIAEMRTKRRS